MIKIKNLRKSFGKNLVLRDIDVEIKPGEVVVIVGSSGSGKSTLLRCINLLETPDSGTIEIEGQDITKPKFNLDQLRTQVGMVFQSFNLFPNLSVIDNIKLAPKKVLKITDSLAARRARSLLKSVGMIDKCNAMPKGLSGGQKQRVAIARALAMQPKIMLFDEPTSALDPEMTGDILQVIKQIAQKGMTIVIVTHEMEFARDVGTRMLFLHQGKIIEDGTPSEVMDNPKTERAKQFFS